MIYQYFLALPELYTRVKINNIQIHKIGSELYEKRLNKFLEKTKLNQMYGDWE